MGIGYDLEMSNVFRKLLLPVICSTLVLVCVSLFITIVLVKLQVLDIPTAYLSTSPGAMSALVALSLDSPAYTSIVVTFHFFRIVFIICTAPLVFKLMNMFITK